MPEIEPPEYITGIGIISLELEHLDQIVVKLLHRMRRLWGKHSASLRIYLSGTNFDGLIQFLEDLFGCRIIYVKLKPSPPEYAMLEIMPVFLDELADENDNYFSTTIHCEIYWLYEEKDKKQCQSQQTQFTKQQKLQKQMEQIENFCMIQAFFDWIHLPPLEAQNANATAAFSAWKRPRMLSFELAKEEDVAMAKRILAKLDEMFSSNVKHTIHYTVYLAHFTENLVKSIAFEELFCTGSTEETLTMTIIDTSTPSSLGRKGIMIKRKHIVSRGNGE